jgi:hypothetical protein
VARRSPYPQIEDDEWFRPVQVGYMFMCCDCSLVHVLNFRVRSGQVEMKATRHKRATAAARRPFRFPPDKDRD